jgi:hypothetical protein
MESQNNIISEADFFRKMLAEPDFNNVYCINLSHLNLEVQNFHCDYIDTSEQQYLEEA